MLKDPEQEKGPSTHVYIHKTVLQNANTYPISWEISSGGYFVWENVRSLDKREKALITIALAQQR
jgi:hypothetical protein